MNEWKNQGIIAMNKEPYHSHTISFDTLEEALAKPREESPYYESLNGPWRFRFFQSINNLPENFIPKMQSWKWDTIQVPGSWQLQGYGELQYLNCRYPFNPVKEKLNPPNTNDESNEVGIYQRSFTVSSKHLKKRQVYLHFAGVEGAFYLWVNGIKVGYSQNSFSPAEFNITNYIHEGANEVTLQVLKYSDGSYLECQDMWALSGIFRDVYLYSKPSVHICDTFLNTEKVEKGYKLAITCKVTNETDRLQPAYYTEVYLYDEDYKPIGSDCVCKGYTGNINEKWVCQSNKLATNHNPKPLIAGTMRSVYMEEIIEEPKPWTAETPYLYHLIILLKDHKGTIIEVIKETLGFRHIYVKEGRLYINDSAILLKGVNYHEFDSLTGRYMLPHKVEADIRMMKQHNINAIRMAHYPHCSYIYELCDKYGLYVMDEANLETHDLSYKDDILPGNDPRWTKSVLDRVTSMIQTHKNHPSIICWSMGNEAGFGENIALMAAYARTVDPSRLIHKRQMNVIGDIDSETYPSVPWLIKRGTDIRNKPFLMNEYGHAMGNAMGNLKEYWQAIYSHHSLAGGFVWEWADHGIQIVEDDGQVKYLYGGDFGEEVHDGNFCIDGIVSVDRQVTAKLIELKKVHEFITIRQIGNFDQFAMKITNHHFHMDLKDYQLVWALYKNGGSVAEGNYGFMELNPGESCQFHLPLNKELLDPHGEYILHMDVVLGVDTNWATRGHVVAWQQFVREPLECQYRSVPSSDEKIKVRSVANNIQMSNKVFHVLYNEEGGFLENLHYQGKPIFDQGPQLQVFRATTDNDLRSSYYRGEGGWKELGLDALHQSTLEYSIVEEDALVTLRIHNRWNTKVESCFIDHYMIITIDTTGVIQVVNHIQPYGMNQHSLPGIGVRFELNKELFMLSWYGKGPEETYRDRKEGAPLGIYHRDLRFEECPYIRPQEYGNKEDTRWFMQMNKEKDYGIAVVMDKGLSFSTRPYTCKELNEKQHLHQLVESDFYDVLIQKEHTGLGNASCGPEALASHQTHNRDYTFSFALVPYNRNLVDEDMRLTDYREEHKEEINKWHAFNHDLHGERPDKIEEVYVDPSDAHVRKQLGY